MDDSALVSKLNAEYEKFCRDERIVWLEESGYDRYAIQNPNNVMEVDPAGRRELAWMRHIEKVGTRWWRERGFKMHWPEGISRAPCKVERYPFCCDMMGENATLSCNHHDNGADCLDVLIYVTDKGSYGIRVHDGGSSFITIMHCPWCGTKLPEDDQ